MSQLSTLQANFQAFLLRQAQGQSFHDAIVDDAKVGAARRLGIYYDAYHLRLVEALSKAYPMLHTLLGDDLFDSTARSYIDAYPSIYPNMRWYGDAMCEHLTNTLPQHPITAELAAFEWTLALAFDAEDSPILQLTNLAEIPPEDWGALSFKFQPSLYWLELNWNTVSVWKALDAEETPPISTQNDAPETWLIWRFELNPRFKSMDVAESAALRLAIQGASFGELCESLQSQLGDEESAIKAAQYLAGWLQEGLIASFHNQSTTA